MAEVECTAVMNNVTGSLATEGSKVAGEKAVFIAVIIALFNWQDIAEPDMQHAGRRELFPALGRNPGQCLLCAGARR